MLISRYIIRNVIIATCLVVAVLAGVDIFMQFFNVVGDIGKGNFTVLKALGYVLMQLPFDVYQFFPMAGFLGCLIGLGRLATTSELVVMRASGVSVLGITASVIKAAILMLIVVTFVGEYIAPKLQNYSEKLKAAAMGSQNTYTGSSGVWLRNKNDFLHVGDVESKNRSDRVTNFIIDNHQLKQVSFAPSANLLPNQKWQMTSEK